MTVDPLVTIRYRSAATESGEIGLIRWLNVPRDGENIALYV